MEIRLARPEDSPGLLAVYAQYIHTPITFECQLPSEAEFAQRILEIGAQYPYLVCQQGDVYKRQVWCRLASIVC